MAEEHKKKTVKKAAAPKAKAAAPRKKKIKVEEPKIEVKPTISEPQQYQPAVIEKKVYVQSTKPRSPLPKGTKYYGTGRRKESRAKVWLAPGTGKFLINGKTMLQYFCGRRVLETRINRPLAVVKAADKYDVFARLSGGGVAAQADAIRMGIARALVVINPELKSSLKREGLLTRDPRMKERKKYGLKRARRAFQYSKR